MFIRRGRCPGCERTFTFLPLLSLPYTHYSLLATRPGEHHLAGNGADFPLVLKLETFSETYFAAGAAVRVKQMTTAQVVGAASHTPVDSPPPCESAASQYRVGLIRFESGCVLVFQGGVSGFSSRMTGCGHKNCLKMGVHSIDNENAKEWISERR